jgi:hypothetical protein
MKTNTITTLILFGVCSLFLISCFSPWTGNEDMGTITISFGGNNNGRAITWPPIDSLIDNIRHEAELIRINESDIDQSDSDQSDSNQLEIITFSFTGVGHHKENVIPGLWRINITAYLDDNEEPYAFGTNEVTVTAGENTQARITMFPNDQITEFFTPIAAAADLLALAEDPSKWSGLIILLENIDLNSISNWTPIGSVNDPFTGIFDGSGFTISNLRINSLLGSNLGLFGVIGEGAIVKDLTLENVNISGGINIGIVAGQNNGGLVENCHTSGNITGTIASFINGGNIGGIVGRNENGTVLNNTSDSNIDGIGNNFGGIVGFNNNGTVENCSSTGNVSGSNNVGGVVGSNSNGIVEGSFAAGTVSGIGNIIGGVAGLNENQGIVQNCYATGNVSGNSQIGGVVGLNQRSTVENSYAAGLVSGTTNVGGVAGMNLLSGLVQNCYAIGEVSGEDNIGGVVGLNQSEGIIQNCYAAGNVSGATNTGGVVGENNNSTVRNNAALNPLIISLGRTSRVVGINLNDGIINNNYGRYGMVVNNYSVIYGEPNESNGGNVDDEIVFEQTWWESANNWDYLSPWDFDNVWYFPNEDILPTLRGMYEADGHVQEPKLLPVED